MDRLLLTGYRGIIGNALYRRLQSAYEVTTLGRVINRADSNQQLTASDSHHVFQDLSHPITAKMPSIDILIHAAGVTDEEAKTFPDQSLQRAWFGTERLLSAVNSASANGLRKLIYISSAHVYGGLQGEIDERNAINPRSLYSNCHYLAEQQCRTFADQNNIPLLIVRPCAVYGFPASLKHFKRWSLIPFGFPLSLVEQAGIELLSNGLQRRNFVSSEQIANTVEHFLSNKPFQLTHGGPARHSGAVYNVVGQDDCSVRDFAQICIEAFQRITGNQAKLHYANGVNLIEDSGSDMAPHLHYRSLYSQFSHSLPLTEFVEHLIEQLIAKEYSYGDDRGRRSTR